ncbi:MAG: alkaline phosphatase family protein [Bacteroidetes bacterium]|nr:MAG: alkaline phosphatase family protein [Bacteroidota bacterium]
MKRVLLFWMGCCCAAIALATPPKPKLVVGLVVEQMRWDYLYRFYDRYTAKQGFKHLLSQGFACQNTQIPYANTVGAAGHASVYTGAVPAVHGITGIEWLKQPQQTPIYCTQDDTEKTIGASNSSGQMSPRQLQVTTFADELKLGTNFRSKVVSIALKDKGAIFPGGHRANAAYWFDDGTGNWVSSSYYMSELPAWAAAFNAKQLANGYYKQGWNTLYPINTYVQSTPDNQPYESNVFGTGAAFPYNFDKFIDKNFNAILSTPHGSSLTFDMARAAIEGEGLGGDSIPDFLGISLSSPDYIGHAFGPNSVEVEDGFLRLDQSLSDFLQYLDSKLGKDAYLLMLTADHGVAHVPAFFKEQHIPAGSLNLEAMVANANNWLKEKTGTANLVSTISNYQVYLNAGAVINSRTKEPELIKAVVDYFQQQPGIYRAIPLDAATSTTLNDHIKQMVVNSYYPLRSGAVQLLLQPHWINGFEARGTTNGAWSGYDAHVPLLWYGWAIKPGQSYASYATTDIAPTLCALLQLQMPSASMGQPILNVIPKP